MEVKGPAVKLLCDFGVSVYLAAATKYLRPGSLSSKQLFLTVPRGVGGSCKFVIGVPAGPGSW